MINPDQCELTEEIRYEGYGEMKEKGSYLLYTFNRWFASVHLPGDTITSHWSGYFCSSSACGIKQLFIRSSYKILSSSTFNYELATP